MKKNYQFKKIKLSYSKLEFSQLETVTTALRELILADALLPTEYRVCMN